MMVSFNIPLLEKVKSKLRKYFFFNKFNKEEVIPFRIFKEEDYCLVFLEKKTKSFYKIIGKSEDGFSFTVEKREDNIDFSFFLKYPKGIVVKDFLVGNKKLIVFGERKIQIALSSDGKNWVVRKKPLIVDSSPLELGGVFPRENGLLILYFQKKKQNEITYYFGHLAYVDKKNPDEVKWHTFEPIWKSTDHWREKKIYHLGAFLIDEKIISYWYIEDFGIKAVIHSGFFYYPATIVEGRPQLERHHQNPVITPKKENHWEAFNTFNPAAFLYENKVHILYRAQGFDYISHIGYAVSSDGYSIDERLDYPIYSPTLDFEKNKTGKVEFRYVSAFGWGGCEDPRVTLIDDRLYMIYVAFDGHHVPRLAMTSILLNDFLKKRWLWEKPILISPPDIVDKSGCLLPEKINNKFVFFHRIFPNILIDFVDDLSFDGKTKWLKGRYQIKVRPKMWDSRKIGIGAPPLKTKDGWLAIYYGVDDKDPSKYQIGAMLLDLKNPTRVLYRSSNPILTPKEEYEVNGFKPGIAYPCGAVIFKEKLLVYYGAADSYVAVAEANLEEFINNLKADKKLVVNPVTIKEVFY